MLSYRQCGCFKLPGRGFTLMEILIVLVLLVITVGFAVLTFGDFGESKKILYAVEQLEQNIRLAQQEAVLENSTLGLRIDNKSYQLVKFHNGTRWISPSKNSLYKIHYFPDGMRVSLPTQINALTTEPALIIDSSGEIAPFSLRFGTLKEPLIVQLIGQKNGELKLIKGAGNGP